MSKLHINRRYFLKGMGTAVALPFLEAMLPSLVTSKAFAAGPAQRFVGIYFANGIMARGAPNTVYNNWECSGTETNFTLSRALQGLSAFQSDISVIHGLTNVAAEEGMRVDGGTAHWLSPSSFLTGQRYETETHATRLKYEGASLDQMIGNATNTKFKSLVVGNNYTTEMSGDSRGSAEVLSQISWKSRLEQPARLVTSKSIFDRLFSDGLPNTSTSQPDSGAIKRNALKLSVVDAIREDAKRLNAKLGAADRQKLDQFLTSVNELEKRVKNEATPQIVTGAACGTIPQGGTYQTDTNQFNTKMIPQRSKNIMDMMVIAFQCDLTRSVSFVLDNEHTGIAAGDLALPGQNYPHHYSSHYLDFPNILVPVKEQFCIWQTAQLAYLLGKLRATSDAMNGGTLLDNTLVMYGSGMGDSHDHSFKNVPVLLAGHGCGHRGGRLLRYPNQNYSNLLATIAEKFGLPAQVGLSNGTLSNLF